MDNRRRVLMSGVEGASSILPAEYQELEYIESTGTQYINTGIYLSSSDVVKCKFELTAATTSLADAILGAYDESNFFVLLMRSPTQARVGTSSNQTTSTNSQVNTLYDISLTNGTYVENGTTYTFTPASDFTQTKSCYIMFRNQTTAAVVPVSAKVYSFEIEGKFNGIPCIRKSDGVTGMYDLINNTFLANAGTGSFIRGPEIIYSAEFNDLKIYGDSIQNEVPSPTSPVDVKSIGTLVTSGQHSGQYEIKILINNGSTLTPYYLYVDEPLRKIGTTADVLDYKNHKVIRNIKEYIFKGTEAVGLGSTSQSNKKRLYISTPGTARSGNNAVTVLCSHYPANTPNRSYTCVLCCSGYDSIGRSCIYDDDYQTTAAFNAFTLGLYNNNTPIKFYGILDTPIEETI